MNDLISRQAAIEALISFFGLSIEEEYGSAIQEVLNGLPPAEPEQRWILVAEKYPEENQICIVTDETRQSTYEYRFCKLTYDEEQGWTYLKHRIIAWMPLPAPWKGEKDAEVH